MTEWIKSVVLGSSYLGVLFLMFLENVFPPIPSELIMPLAGFFSTQGDMSFAGIVAAGTTGSVLGAIALFYLGRWAGEERLRRFVERHGHWIVVSVDDLDKSRAWFDRHGAKAVLLCRMVPGVRSLISIPAGLARMSMVTFLLLTTIGSAVWTAALAYAGRALGSNYEQVEHVIGPVSTAIMVAIILALVIRGVRQYRKRKVA